MSEDIWVKVDADRHSVKIEYVGDQSLLPKLLADLPPLQSGIQESDEVAIARESSNASIKFRQADTEMENRKSRDKLYTWAVMGFVAVSIVFLFVACGGGGRKSESNNGWNGAIDRFAQYRIHLRLDG